MIKLIAILAGLGVCAALVDIALANLGQVATIGIGIGALALIAIVISGGPEVKGARWMTFFEELFFANRWHRGFVVNGRRRRLSQQVSFQSVLALGPMGSGKTARITIPNILKLAEQNCSIVVNDLGGGEIYDLTSGYLAKRGFNVQTLNLMSPTESEQFNPLSNLTSFTDTARAVSTIMTSSLSHHSDPFWSTGAEKILRIIATCLCNRNDEEHCNLANLKFVLSRFSEPSQDGPSAFDEFVIASTIRDPQTYNDYRSFIGGSQKTIQSFVSSADAALMALGNRDLELLTARSTIDFRSLREQKTGLYVIARQQDMRFLSFIVNLFWQRLFDSLMSERNDADLPVYALLDEFGQMALPDFAVVATTARKYRLAMCSLVQSMAQLEVRYGARGAQIIRDSLGTLLVFGGTGVETTTQLERRLGKVKTRIGDGEPPAWREENLLDAHEIAALHDDKMLVLSGNRPPVIVTTTPYYTQQAMRDASRLPPYPLPHIDQADVSYVTLGKTHKESVANLSSLTRN